jgi:hypothetical protein
MSAIQRDRAERVSHNAHISYIAATQILSAARQNNYHQLAIHTEKHMMNGEHMEKLKEMGLTILDCLTGEYDEFSQGQVETIFADWNDRLGERVYNPVI